MAAGSCRPPEQPLPSESALARAAPNRDLPRPRLFLDRRSRPLLSSPKPVDGSYHRLEALSTGFASVGGDGGGARRAERDRQAAAGGPKQRLALEPASRLSGAARQARERPDLAAGRDRSLGRHPPPAPAWETAQARRLGAGTAAATRRVGARERRQALTHRERADRPGGRRESVPSRSEAEVSVRRPDPSPRAPDARAPRARPGSAAARARGRGAAPLDPRVSSRRPPTT